MGYAKDHDRVVIKVTVSEEEQASLVKKGLEESGIIYAEGEREVCFSIVPTQRNEDLQRAKEMWLSASR